MLTIYPTPLICIATHFSVRKSMPIQLTFPAFLETWTECEWHISKIMRSGENHWMEIRFFWFLGCILIPKNLLYWLTTYKSRTWLALLGFILPLLMKVHLGLSLLIFHGSIVFSHHRWSRMLIQLTLAQSLQSWKWKQGWIIICLICFFYHIFGCSTPHYYLSSRLVEFVPWDFVGAE